MAHRGETADYKLDCPLPLDWARAAYRGPLKEEWSTGIDDQSPLSGASAPP